MKLRYLLSIGLALALTQTVSARGADDKGAGKNTNSRPSLAAGCSPANSIIYLEYNNVRTRVETGGLWWQDRANSAADYEVPKGSNSFAIYAGGLWLAGTDVNGQLKAAVSKFGQGVDYYSGPLNNDGTAEIDEERCENWDEFFEITRQEVAEFVLYNSSSEDARKELFPDGYDVPKSIQEWPGNGLFDSDSSDNALLAPKLAPYIDVNSDGIYDWRDGDYPFYDLGATLNANITDSSLVNSDGIVDCRAPRIDRSQSASRPLFGDKTYWWIFNDKGNLHTESNAPSIGMEIHAQAFAFATNDEINDMTFYNFELINRSTFTLTDTYFASYVDPDLGNPSDDYVGCDVTRGFGYCYNGDERDEDFQGQTGYGETPACIGIDFFEGPFQDADGINNNVGIRPGEALNGLGYFDPAEREPDTIIDNERFGMRRFVYYNIGGGQNGDPTLAIHYYNYMRGIWQNGQLMRHGGNGLNTAGVEDIPTAFMFPGDTDPLHWGTVDEQGIPIIPSNNNWTEDDPGGGEERNAPGDRRFLQSAGPFTLEPGNVNDITVGVVFGQAESGGRLASVEVAFTADIKSQALFDNCFQVLNGPDAPDLTIRELDQELLFYITNNELSNNFNEEYEEEDPNIVTPDDLAGQNPPIFYDNKYRFQGYQVFQMATSTASVVDIYDPSLSRLVFQCDIVDGDTTLVNYTFDEILETNFPQVMVEGANEGIAHSFRVTEDLFAEGSTRLVNFKTYYYIAIAYATNNYKLYAQDVSPDPNLPFKAASDGQKTPYLASRRTAGGGAIESIPAIPSDPTYLGGGTVLNSSYGDIPGITRWQGTGNGGNELEFTQATIDRIMEDKDWETGSLPVELEYKLNSGPIEVKVVDPLNVISANFVFKMVNDESGGTIEDTARWNIERENSDFTDELTIEVFDTIDGQIISREEIIKVDTFETVSSQRPISTPNEQLLAGVNNRGEFNWGLSVDIGQVDYPSKDELNTGYIGATIETQGGTANQWLGGIADSDGESAFNWILSGTVGGDQGLYADRFIGASDNFIDPREDYEAILGGTWSPYALAGYGTAADNKVGYAIAPSNASRLEYLKSTVVVFTSDKSKWTRVPVLETQEDLVKSTDGTDWLRPRRQQLSVDKDGNPFDTLTLTAAERADIRAQLALPYNLFRIDSLKARYGSDVESDANFISPVGMGWFPGYALDLETGERLNMAFGEDTWQGADNGADMLWNPTSTFVAGAADGTELVWGGKHYTYIFRKTTEREVQDGNPAFLSDEFPQFQFFNEMVTYDAGSKLMTMLNSYQDYTLTNVWRSCSWVTVPMLNAGATLLQSDVKVNLQVATPYEFMVTDVVDTIINGPGDTTFENLNLENEGRPTYTFSTNGFAAQTGLTSVLEDALVDVNVVPNPYYAISEYEGSALDNVVKITNLPQFAEINIYNMSGTLIRTFNKADPAASLDWDLTNQAGIPISSGVYIIHVEVPNVGEKVLKWFGVTRPVDLENF